MLRNLFKEPRFEREEGEEDKEKDKHRDTEDTEGHKGYFFFWERLHQPPESPLLHNEEGKLTLLLVLLLFFLTNILPLCTSVFSVTLCSSFSYASYPSIASKLGFMYIVDIFHTLGNLPWSSTSI